jgi:hypothetical protein
MGIEHIPGADLLLDHIESCDLGIDDGVHFSFSKR